MLRHFALTAFILTAPFMIQGCSDSGGTPATTGGSAKTGGVTVAGGTPGTGGTTSTGGVVAATGGITATGGTTGTGGQTATGGRVATGGTTSTGGNTSAGGNAATGGTSSTGGSAPTGGSATTGGTSSTGGTSTGGAASGGTVSTGGTSTGGTTNTGGSVATGGSAATGGSSATGGTTSANGSCRVWMATTGKDTNDGSDASPVLTLTAAYDLICPKADGKVNGDECTGPAPRTICIKAGTYAMATRFEDKKTRMGTASNRVTIMGDPAASTRPLLDFSTQPRLQCGAKPDDGNIGGITIGGNYTTIKNLEIKGANDNCIKMQGAYGIVENVAVHHCADAGIQIGSGSGYTGSGTNNLILNCDSYLNNDTQCNGENADGFGLKEGTGAGNVFRGCRAWDNADDGWDLYAWTSPVTIENSWAISQCKTTKGSASDGNGFKLGGDDVSAKHVLKDLYATDNNFGSSGSGFTNNSNPAAMSCDGTCASWGNKASDKGVSGVGTSAPSGATAAKMIDAKRGADGSLPAITSL